MTEFGASRASKRRPRLAEQARMARVEPEADGLTRLRLEIAFALHDELPGRSVDIEDRRIAETFDDRDGAGESRLRIVRIDDGQMLRPHPEFGGAHAGAGAHADLRRPPARQDHARRLAVHGGDVDAEEVHAG